MKICDLFQYSGENDLLEIRLNTHNDIVDYFFIVESPKTHSLVQKPLYLLQARDRFANFANKIVYLPIDYCEYQNAFFNDWAARMVLFNSLPREECIIVHSDLDEIADPNILLDVIKNLKHPTSLKTNYYMFCVDLWGRKCNGPIIMKKSWVTREFYKFRDVRNNDKIFELIPEAGWHYSSVGTPEEISRKWKSFAHFNEILDEYKDPEYIKKQIARKAGSWAESEPDGALKLVEHKYPNLPQYLVDNKEKFKHLFYNHYESSN